MDKLKYAFAVVLGLSVVANSAYGEILRTVDFEDGSTSLSANPYLSPSGNPAEVVGAQSGVTPRNGKRMMRTYLSRLNSDVKFRTEATLDSPGEFKKGVEYWMGLSIFLPANWDMNYGGWTSEGIVWQFHGRQYLDPTWRETLPIVAMHTPNGWRIQNFDWFTSARPSGGNFKKFSVVAPYKLGKWNDFVLNFKFSGATSPDDTDGFIKVWVNGTEVVNLTGQNFFGEQTMGPYFKFGLYNSQWQFVDKWAGPSERLLWHDELRIGGSKSSYAEVSPPVSDARPMPPEDVTVDGG